MASHARGMPGPLPLLPLAAARVVAISGSIVTLQCGYTVLTRRHCTCEARFCGSECIGSNRSSAAAEGAARESPAAALARP